MKYSKKFVAASVAATLVVPTVAMAEQATPISTNALFTDLVPNSYYYDAVVNLADRGIIHGYGNGLFGPNDAITRGQAAKFITGMLNLNVEDIDNPNFTDVSTTHMFYKEIAALKKADIVTGYDDTTYRPDDTITRNEMAIILTRAFNLQTTTEIVPFTDVSNYMLPFVSAIYSEGITEGVNATTFAGNETVSRAQAATFMYRAETGSDAKPVVLQAPIEGVANNFVKIGGTLYGVGAYAQILHTGNEAALKGAVVHATVQNGTIIDIESLEVVAQGTEEAPVTLTKVAAPTASVDAVPSDVLDFALLINTPFMKVANLSFAQVELLEKVAALQFDGSAESLTIRENVKAVISGLATINELIVQSEQEISLNIEGTINKLSIDVAKALITLAKTLKVTEVVAVEGTKLEDIITNLQDVLDNIGTVNAGEVGESETPAVTPPTSGGNDNSYIPPTNPQPPTGNVSGDVITAATESAVTIGGKTYTLASSLASFFKNSNLAGSSMTFTAIGDQITAINSLNVSNAGKIVGDGTVITGNVTVTTENVTLQGLTVKGDLVVKGNVLGNVTVNSTVVEGKVVTEETQQAAFYSRMAIAATDFIPMATTNVTRLRITFNDSTVAILEIKSSDSVLSFNGATVVSLIDVQSNSSIVSDPDVILPSVRISQGVTNIVLNASIASVQIETTSAIEVSGNGNFDKVEVKSSQPVTLNTTGVINTLTAAASNNAAAPAITLGASAKVGKTEDAVGNTVKPEDIISNANDPAIQQNINENHVEDTFIAAKLIPVPNKFGFATLSVLNKDTNKVFYEYSTDATQIKKKGEALPTTVKEYKENDEIIPWFDKGIHVYTVNSANEIVDSFDIEEYNNRFFSQTDLQIINNQLVLKTTFTQNVKGDQFIISKLNSLEVVDEKTKLAFTLDENGIPTLVIPTKSTFGLGELVKVHVDISSLDERSGFSTWEYIGDYSDMLPVDISNLQQYAQLYINKVIEHDFHYVLDSIAYELEEVVDGQYTYYRHKPITNKYLYDYYAVEFAKQKATSQESVKEKVKEMNTTYANEVKQFEEADKQVTALYKENRYSYDYFERLAPSTTLAVIEAAEMIVNKLPDGNVKVTLLQDINSAKNILSQIQYFVELNAIAKQYVAVKSTTSSDTATIENALTAFSDKLKYRFSAKSMLMDQYAQALVKGMYNTNAKVTALIDQVNQQNSALTANYDELVAAINGLYEPSTDENYRTKLVATVNQNQIASIKVNLETLKSSIDSKEYNNFLRWLNYAEGILSSISKIPTLNSLANSYLTVVESAKLDVKFEIETVNAQTTSYNASLPYALSYSPKIEMASTVTMS